MTRNKRFPRYEDDADYTTNAPSYYHDLGRKNKLLEKLAKKIWEYDERLNERLNELNTVLSSYLDQWDERIENLDDEVSHIFVTWLNDGTLEQIINHHVLGNKADKSYVDDLNENVTAQLAQTEIKKLNRGENESITKSMLSQEIKEELNSGAIEFTLNTSEIEDKAITNQKISDESVSPSKINGAHKSVNLFNPKAITRNYLAQASGLNPSEVFGVTDLIPVIGGEVYTTSDSFANHVVFYNESKAFISTLGTATFTVPSNARYMRVNFRLIRLGEYMLVRGSTLPTSFIPYSVTLNWLSLEDETINHRHLVKNLNLINPYTLQVGYVVVDGSTPTPNSAYSVTDYIEIESNQEYIFNHATAKFATFFNANKAFISTMTATTEKQVFVTPSNAQFMRLNFLNTVRDDIMVFKGNQLPTEYVPYQKKIEWLQIEYDNLSPELKERLGTGEASGETIHMYGDSITWQDGKVFGSTHVEEGTLARGWQTHIREQLEANVINQGVSGNTMSDISARIRSATFSNSDIVTITAGVNDSRLNIEVGEVLPIGSTFVHSTYTGALQMAIENLIQRYPEITIFLITPVKGWTGGKLLDPAYIGAMKQVADLYSLPVCDLYYQSGINEKNRASYFGDKDGSTNGNYVHLVNKGYEKTANILIPFLENH